MMSEKWEDRDMAYLQKAEQLKEVEKMHFTWASKSQQMVRSEGR